VDGEGGDGKVNICISQLNTNKSIKLRATCCVCHSSHQTQGRVVEVSDPNPVPCLACQHLRYIVFDMSLHMPDLTSIVVSSEPNDHIERRQHDLSQPSTIRHPLPPMPLLTNTRASSNCTTSPATVTLNHATVRFTTLRAQADDLPFLQDGPNYSTCVGPLEQSHQDSRDNVLLVHETLLKLVAHGFQPTIAELAGKHGLQVPSVAALLSRPGYVLRLCGDQVGVEGPLVSNV
jgi:hypothetical protein